MSGAVIIGISDQKVVKAPDTLITYALGSCVGICMYDPVTSIGGMAHIILPSSKECTNNDNKYKFADLACAEMLRTMELQGCKKIRITAKIAGGAQMFATQSNYPMGNIGQRNVIAVKQALRELGIRITAEDTGLNYGRTVEFNPETGEMKVKSVTMGIKIL